MRLPVLAALLAPLVASSPAWSKKPAAEAPATAPGLVFVANTGLEDAQTLVSSLRHAAAAKESGYLDEVVWLVYGRATLALDPALKVVPAAFRENLDKAKAAGVRLVVCAHALEQNGVDRASIDPQIEVVPNAMSELGRLVAGGLEVLRY